jgi:DNA-binding protein YbaB
MDDEQVIRARDDGNLVEIGVDPAGRVVEVALNAEGVARASVQVLADAVLRAAAAAQDRAARLAPNQGAAGDRASWDGDGYSRDVW